MSKMVMSLLGLEVCLTVSRWIDMCVAICLRQGKYVVHTSQDVNKPFHIRSPSYSPQSCSDTRKGLDFHIMCSLVYKLCISPLFRILKQLEKDKEWNDKPNIPRYQILI